MTPLLFTPITIRGITLRNRTVLAPMCQYSANDGVAGDWHLVHLGKFALGGMGVVMTEATAVEERGRITYGDLGIWSDSQISGLKRITDFVRSQGAAAAIQIAHAGRKASSQRPWHGHGHLGEVDGVRGELPWKAISSTDDPYFTNAQPPTALSRDDIEGVVARFGEAAARADAAGFDIVEIHGGHGYLIASFLSPAINKRVDDYGGDLNRRMRFPLEVAVAVRANWPVDKPLFFRISTVDGAERGWSVEDSVVLSNELKRCGIDAIDCSSGGAKESGTLANTFRGPGYQVPYASEIRRRCQIPSIAVGLILDGRQAEAILRAQHADLVAIGREVLYDPYWAYHAAQALDADIGFRGWPEQSGWWLERRARSLPKKNKG
jgi:2,4-dienoyl-CoA reductase-like NADH-dependent reductase (Old Yellow Enzyme family)